MFSTSPAGYPRPPILNFKPFNNKSVFPTVQPGSHLFSTPSEQQIFCFAFFHISSRSFFENHAVLKKFTTHAIFVTSAPIATPQFPASTPSIQLTLSIQYYRALCMPSLTILTVLSSCCLSSNTAHSPNLTNGLNLLH